MECVRENGRLLILGDDSHPLAELVPIGAEQGDAFRRLAEQMAATLGPALPRVVVTYREGLLDEVRADSACAVLLVEEDPFDEPPVTIRRRETAGDAAAVDAALARAEALRARAQR